MDGTLGMLVLAVLYAFYSRVALNKTNQPTLGSFKGQMMLQRVMHRKNRHPSRSPKIHINQHIHIAL
jgi:hypothetical protein